MTSQADIRAAVAVALATHVGHMLTLELAQKIAQQICETPDKSFDPQNFLPVDYKGYVLALEQFRGILPELHVLHQRHYAEVDTSGIPLNGDHDAIKLSEHNGGLMQFTSRVKATGELVGAMRIYIGLSRHTQTLFAEEDTFYVVPEHRGGFMAVRLWQFAEAAVIKAGVREITFDSKTMNHADSMARYLKYRPVSTKFSKTIPKD